MAGRLSNAASSTPGTQISIVSGQPDAVKWQGYAEKKAPGPRGTLPTELILKLDGLAPASPSPEVAEAASSLAPVVLLLRIPRLEPE